MEMQDEIMEVQEEFVYKSLTKISGWPKQS